MSDDDQDLPEELTKRFRDYAVASRRDAETKRLLLEGKELGSKLAANRECLRDRQSELARITGLVFPDLSAIERAFPDYRLREVREGAMGHSFDDEVPFLRVVGSDDEVTIELYRCDSCKGFVLGQPKEYESANPDQGIHGIVDIFYSCRICDSEIARDSFCPFN